MARPIRKETESCTQSKSYWSLSTWFFLLSKSYLRLPAGCFSSSASFRIAAKAPGLFFRTEISGEHAYQCVSHINPIYSIYSRNDDADFRLTHTLFLLAHFCPINLYKKYRTPFSLTLYSAHQAVTDDTRTKTAGPDSADNHGRTVCSSGENHAG